MMHALGRYAGEPHRLQLIATIDGVAYYDDSKGTNVGATVAALEGLGAEGKKLVVIAGGDGKGQNFEPLAAPVARHARAVVVLGRDAAAIRSALEVGAPGVPLFRCATPLSRLLVLHQRMRVLATPCCCLPRVQASTCFATTCTAAKSLRTRCESYREEAGQPC